MRRGTIRKIEKYLKEQGMDQGSFPAGAESEGAAGGLYCGDFRAEIPFEISVRRCGGGAVPRTLYPPYPDPRDWGG